MIACDGGDARFRQIPSPLHIATTTTAATADLATVALPATSSRNACATSWSRLMRPSLRSVAATRLIKSLPDGSAARLSTRPLM